MKVIINNTTINVINCGEIYDYEGRYLQIVINKSEIDGNTLNDLVFGNIGTIIREDNDGDKKSFVGFDEDPNITIDSDTYVVIFNATTSSDKRINALETAITEKDAEISELGITLEQKNSEITELTNYIENDIENAIYEGVNDV